jgi:hypothetical protein
VESLVTAVLIPTISPRQGTFYSQERFIEAVASAEGNPSVRVLKIQSGKSSACIFGLARIRRLNRQTISLAPFGFPAYPIGDTRLNGCISGLVGQLQRIRTVSFDWNVRFDHVELANELTDLGLSRTEYTTQVLDLDRPYSALFRAFSETTRKEIRRAARKGVVVRQTTNPDDVARYYMLYRKVIAERREWNYVYSQPLFEKLFQLRENVILLVAELNNMIIAGGWFIRDDDSLFYWQCAMNYEFEHYFPYYAIVSHGIQLAADNGMKTFNMGTSPGKPSIEQFKSFWGTRKVPQWTFAWENPLWSSISRIRRRITW